MSKIHLSQQQTCSFKESISWILSQTHHLITQISQLCKEICDIKSKAHNSIPTSMPTLLVRRTLVSRVIYMVIEHRQNTTKGHQPALSTAQHIMNQLYIKLRMSSLQTVNSSLPMSTPSSSAPAESLMQTMHAGEDSWDEPLIPPATRRGWIPDPPEEDEDKGRTVLPASAEMKVESELSHTKQWEQSYLRLARRAAFSSVSVHKRLQHWGRLQQPAEQKPKDQNGALQL